MWGFNSATGQINNFTFLASQFVKVNQSFTGTFGGSTDNQLFQVGGFSGPLCIILSGAYNGPRN